ncbi:DUF3761 domain-containing protein [Amycolatopsis sp. GM8]|uniref:DUF3761 domain-containing protein n=1 Tax=Amycolatopsis sp. GM8 TaxID=2896530 RepID=UPI00271526A3|nr:DUF3761 domain-containing protein [Amycolatopsis sp. GM8]
MSAKRLSSWVGAFALGAVLAGCGVTTPSTPVTPPTTTTISSSAVAPVAPAPVITTTTTPPAAAAPAPVVQQAPPPPAAHTTAKRTTETTQKAAVGCSGGYINVDGNCVPRPTHADSPPAGATAHCKDGTYSFSQHRQGTCSGHGGVAQWL